jgi:hypothetical protein
MKRHVALISALALSALALASTATADPSNNSQSPITLGCDNGLTVVVNPGTMKNHSHIAFVVSSSGGITSTSISVANYLAVTDSSGTNVIFDTAPGLTAQGLVTCTADVGDGATLTVKGFFTPRG